MHIPSMAHKHHRAIDPQEYAAVGHLHADASKRASNHREATQTHQSAHPIRSDTKTHRISPLPILIRVIHFQNALADELALLHTQLLVRIF
jgi:hypothetical protein